MTDFILQLAVFLSLGAIVYILARAIPRIEEEERTQNLFFGRLAAHLPVHKFDAALASFLEKNLRKMRVVLLKVDNGVSNFLGKIKTNGNGSGGNGQKSLFTKEVAKENQEELPPNTPSAA